MEDFDAWLDRAVDDWLIRLPAILDHWCGGNWVPLLDVCTYLLQQPGDSTDHHRVFSRMDHKTQQRAFVGSVMRLVARGSAVTDVELAADFDSNKYLARVCRLTILEALAIAADG